MKATLRSAEGAFFPLEEQFVKLGSGKCDINIPSNAVDREHATVEWSAGDEGYIVRDLSKSHGTYVNDVRVPQNCAIKLQHHDVIRLGHGGPKFDFAVDQNVQYRPAIVDQQAWDDAAQHSTRGTSSSYLPFLPTFQQSTPLGQTTISSYTPMLSNYNNGGSVIEGVFEESHGVTATSGVTPHPPHQGRPYSAGNSVKFKIQTGGAASSSPPISRPFTAAAPSRQSNPPPQQHQYERPNALLQLHGNSFDPTARIQELEQCIASMSTEISRLSSFEAECYRKDAALASLRSENTELKGFNSFAIPAEMEPPGADVQQKLASLQRQISKKNDEISNLKTQLKEDHDLIPATTAASLAAESSATNSSTNHIASLQTKLCNRDARIASLTSEVSALSKQKAQLSTLVSGLQKDVDTREQNMKKAKAEVEKSRVIVRNKTAEIATLTTKLAQQAATAEAELERTKKDDDNKHLRNRLRSIEEKMKLKVAMCGDLEKDIDKLKTAAKEAEKAEYALQVELQSVSGQLSQVERQEQKWKIEAQSQKKQYERLQHNLSKTLGSSNVSSVEEISSSVDKLNTDLKSTESRLETTLFELEKLETEKREASEARDLLIQMATRVEAALVERGRSSTTLLAEIETLQAADINESIGWCKELVLNILTHELAWERGIEEALDTVVEQSSSGPPDRIGRLRERLVENKDKIDQLEINIVASETEHANMFKEFQAKTKEMYTRKSQKAVDAMQKEIGSGHAEAIAQLTQAHQKELSEAVQAEQTLFEKEFGEIIGLRKRLKELALTEGPTLTDEIDRLQSELKTSKENETSLQAELNSANMELTMESDKLNELKRLVHDMDSYKEQTHQHSLTIVALEEKVLIISREKRLNEQELLAAQQQIESLSQKQKLSPRRPKSAAKKSERAREPDGARISIISNENIRLRAETKRLELQISGLRADSGKDQRDELIATLRKDLTEAKARLSDVAAELNEQQKQKIEEMEHLLKEKDFQIKELDQKVKEMLLAQNDLPDGNEELAEFLAGKSESPRKLESPRKGVTDAAEMSDGKGHRNWLEKSEPVPVTVAQPKRTTNYPPLDEEEAMKATLKPADLANLGARCLGERHSNVIQKQKDALAQLRMTLNSLDHLRPKVHTHEVALQKLADARKDIENLREELAKHDIDAQRGDDELLAEVHVARELLATAANDCMIEKDSHQETRDALHLSEDMYLKLVRHIADLVGMKELDGCGPIAYSQVEDRNEILQERHKTLTMVVDKVKLMLNRLQRKEELLQEYDTDLRALKNAEMYGEQKTNEVKALQEKIHQLEEEIGCMKEALKRTRADRDDQTRKNVGLSQRKVFMMDTPKVAPSSHDCCTDEQKLFKEQEKIRKKNEKIRRKNHEIHSLKKELQNADDKLVNTRSQLHEFEVAQMYDEAGTSVDLDWVGSTVTPQNISPRHATPQNISPRHSTSVKSSRSPRSSVHATNDDNFTDERSEYELEIDQPRPSSAARPISRSSYDYDLNEPPERDIS